MRLTYDETVQAAYLWLIPQDEVVAPVTSVPVARSGARSADLIIDLDAKDRIVGFEFLNPQTQLSVRALAGAEPLPRAGRRTDYKN